jgi:ribosomal-protein-alanine N-acetyltransferase
VEDLTEVRTPRLLLRRVEQKDWEHLRRMDTDPTVMATMGGLRSLEETKEYASSQVVHWERHGFGWWIAFDLATSEFVGRGGVRVIELEGREEVEVGYGLLPTFWGRGLATELARAATRAGFEVLQLSRLIGITLPTNAPSRRVLEKIGFSYVRDTVYKGLPHVLYDRLREEA